MGGRRNKRDGGKGREGRWEVLTMSNKLAWREVTSGAGSVEEALNEAEVQLCVSLWTDAAEVGGGRREEVDLKRRKEERKYKEGWNRRGRQGRKCEKRNTKKGLRGD